MSENEIANNNEIERNKENSKINGQLRIKAHNFILEMKIYKCLGDSLVSRSLIDCD